MKLRLHCPQCAQTQTQEFRSVEQRDDGLYAMKCERGHSSVIAIQQQKFELLFDMGAMAFVDGYSREAISSIAAALERFLEFYTTVVCLDRDIKFEAIQEAWKPLSNASERQMGAFLTAYLIVNSEPLRPMIWDAKPPDSGNRQTWSAFRNSVIHKGYIPTEQEVIAYGDLVYQFIYRMIDELRTTCESAMLKATAHHLKRVWPMREEGSIVSTMAIPTLISLSHGTRANTFLAALKSLGLYRNFLYDSGAQR